MFQNSNYGQGGCHQGKLKVKRGEDLIPSIGQRVGDVKLFEPQLSGLAVGMDFLERSTMVQHTESELDTIYSTQKRQSIVSPLLFFYPFTYKQLTTKCESDILSSLLTTRARPAVLGVNFGQSYASIAVIDKEGHPLCIANEEGERQIACAISYAGEQVVSAPWLAIEA